MNNLVEKLAVTEEFQEAGNQCQSENRMDAAYYNNHKWHSLHMSILGIPMGPMGGTTLVSYQSWWDGNTTFSYLPPIALFWKDNSLLLPKLFQVVNRVSCTCQ